MFDNHKFITLLVSFHYGRKLSTLRAFVFTVGKKLHLNPFQLNEPIPL